MTSNTPTDLQRIRVDHIGSLVRPRKLKEAFARYDHGQITADELRRVQDEAVRDVIKKQEAHGLAVLTDGEFRRHNFQESFSEAVSGFDVPKKTALYYEQREVNLNPLERAEQNFDEAGPAIITRRAALERLKLVRNLPLEEFCSSQGVATQSVKVTLIGPDRIAQRFKWEASRAVYRDLDDFVEDVVAIERRMIADLVRAGCRYIQIDAPGYTAYVDPISLDRMRSRGEDPERNLERSIQADNALIEGFPGVIFGIHICRGNARTVDPETGKLVPQWHREGHYDAIAERLFHGLKHQRLLLEYDSERAGGFEPLRFVPKDKVVVLGLVTTKSPDLEPLDELKRRIDQASRYVPLEQLALSPQCGFGGLDSKAMSEDEMWRKFDRIVETAGQVWG
ncbi:MAG TPA: cobalamin-independent methionine synthase II family protein [Candidatus Binatia bacterium]|nr:cobalamin-independent methionine synthase II family protein [Candidatus Binatia bacterium]